MSDTTSQPSSSFPPSSPSATPVNQSTTAQANEATRMAAIIGGTVGGLLLLAIVVAAIVVPRQRRRKAAKEIRKRQMVDFDPPFWDGNAGVGSGKLGGDKEDRHGSGNSDNGSGNGNGNRNMNSSWKKKKEYPVNDGTFGTRGGRNHRSTESDLVGMLPLLGNGDVGSPSSYNPNFGASVQIAGGWEEGAGVYPHPQPHTPQSALREQRFKQLQERERLLGSAIDYPHQHYDYEIEQEENEEDRIMPPRPPRDAHTRPGWTQYVQQHQNQHIGGSRGTTPTGSPRAVGRPLPGSPPAASPGFGVGGPRPRNGSPAPSPRPLPRPTPGTNLTGAGGGGRSAMTHSPKSVPQEIGRELDVPERYRAPVFINPPPPPGAKHPHDTPQGQITDSPVPQFSLPNPYVDNLHSNNPFDPISKVPSPPPATSAFPNVLERLKSFASAYSYNGGSVRSDSVGSEGSVYSQMSMLGGGGAGGVSRAGSGSVSRVGSGSVSRAASGVRSERNGERNVGLDAIVERLGAEDGSPASTLVHTHARGYVPRTQREPSSAPPMPLRYVKSVKGKERDGGSRRLPTPPSVFSERGERGDERSGSGDTDSDSGFATRGSHFTGGSHSNTGGGSKIGGGLDDGTNANDKSRLDVYGKSHGHVKSASMGNLNLGVSEGLDTVAIGNLIRDRAKVDGRYEGEGVFDYARGNGSPNAREGRGSKISVDVNVHRVSGGVRSRGEGQQEVMGEEKEEAEATPGGYSTEAGSEDMVLYSAVSNHVVHLPSVRTRLRVEREIRGGEVRVPPLPVRAATAGDIAEVERAPSKGSSSNQVQRGSPIKRLPSGRGRLVVVERPEGPRDARGLVDRRSSMERRGSVRPRAVSGPSLVENPIKPGVRGLGVRAKARAEERGGAGRRQPVTPPARLDSLPRLGDPIGSAGAAGTTPPGFLDRSGLLGRGGADDENDSEDRPVLPPIVQSPPLYPLIGAFGMSKDPSMRSPEPTSYVFESFDVNAYLPGTRPLNVGGAGRG